MSQGQSQVRLSAKDILGNRASLSKWQDDFHAAMVKAFPDLERGESSKITGRQHVPMRVFKQAQHLTEQMKQITDLLGTINPLNTGKKKEEAMQLLTTFFPQMENFETLIRKIVWIPTTDVDLMTRAKSWGWNMK
jgi:hypothetical protein